MPSSPRRSGSRQSRSRPASNISIRSSRTSSYRNAAQQTSDRSPRRNSSARRRSTSPPRPVSPRPRSPSPSPSHAPNRKRFGLNVPNAVPRFAGKFDFEDRYPEDPIYEEMGPNARLWRAFLDESEVFDMDMVTESRDGLDLLLVFTGLFSAVLTTFIVQTSQALSANIPAVSSSLLVEMVALQRAQIKNTPIDDILPANTAAGPSGFDVWVNALWFTSLTLSLGTALMAVLVKQWLYQYMSMISGTARDRSLIRFYRFEGLQKWHVLTIIGTLPIILHIALGLFLAGLVVFLIPLNIPLACIVGFITFIIYNLYAISNILPIIYRQCPYRTPFSDILNVMLRAARTFPSLVVMRVCKLFPVFGVFANTVTATGPVFRTLKDAERIAATNDEVAEEVAWRALLWLYDMSSNPPTKRIIQESLGCLSDDVSKRSKDLQAELGRTLGEISPSTYDHHARGWRRLIPPGQEHRVERILRAVRDPLAPRDRVIAPDAPWKLITDSELTFQTLTSILVHAPSISVEMDSIHWGLPSLLNHLIDNQYSPTPILLPPHLWTLLIDSSHRTWSHRYTSDLVVELCEHAIRSFECVTVKQSSIPPPFAGPVTLTHRTVLLLHLVADLLVHRLGIPHAPDSFFSESLTKLFTIYDYAASESNLDLNSTTTARLSILIDIWAAVGRHDELCDDDRRALCRRVENTCLQMSLTDDWWDGQDDGIRCLCYSNVLGSYNRHNLPDVHSNSYEFFKKLLSDFSSSLTRDSPSLLDHISRSLVKLSNQLGSAPPAYYLLFCASPFLSTRTLSSYDNCICFLYPVVSTFVESASKMPRDIVLRGLLAEPHRVYTICWILTFGDEEHRRVTLLQLARIDPTHAVWDSRTHYMNMDPQDWPYLRLCDEFLRNKEFVMHLKGKMKESLQILDIFFASLNTPPDNPTAIQDTPPQNNTVSQTFPSRYPYWRHIRRFISGTRAFLAPSTSHSTSLNVVDDMELGLGLSMGVTSAGTEANSHEELDTQAPRLTPLNSSCSSGIGRVTFLYACSNPNAPRPSHRLLHAPLRSALPIIPPQNIESSAISTRPFKEMEHDKAEAVSGESPQSNVRSTIPTTVIGRAYHSGIYTDSVNMTPPETSSPKEAEDVEITSGVEPSHPDILATIQETPPLPGAPSSESLHLTTSGVFTSASRRSSSSDSLIDAGLQRPPSGGSLPSSHRTISGIGVTASAEPPNAPDFPTEII